MAKLYTISAFLTLLCAVRADVYPTVFPFENEAVEIGAPFAATPSHTYDETDAGGYHYTYLYELNEFPFLPICLKETGYWYYGLVILYEIESRPPVRSTTYYNCTLKGPDYIIQAAAFPGDIDNEKVCEQGECCVDWVGTEGFWGGAVEDSYGKEWYETEAQAGICGADWTESLYCFSMGFDSHNACQSTIVTPGTRINNRVTGCYDTKVHFFLGCPVYVEAGFKYDSNEPANYYEASTPDQLIATGSIHLIGDKLCKPYSYYFPQYAKTASANESNGESDLNEESSAALTGFLLAIIVLLL